MPNIFYFKDSSGRECAKWPGVSKRKKVVKDGVVQSVSYKEGQLQLGLVIDREKLIFFKGSEGFYQFHPDDQSCTDIDPSLLPQALGKTDRRKREKPVIIQFGGSYFLDCFITGIQYRTVIDAIQYQNSDRLYAMLHYYLLSNGAASAAQTWYEFNYTKFLYPGANLANQRISDFLAAIGSDANRRSFLMAHIKYLLKSTDDELCILVDSTGMPNKCCTPYTMVSNHDGDINIEFRVIVVVQKSTGLPVYYEMIPGNVVDCNTLSNVMRKLKNYGYNVQYAMGDAAYSCPSNIERLVLAGIDFMTRLNPAYETFAKAYEEHASELLNNTECEVMYHDRLVTVVKIPSVIAVDNDGNEITGYIYLCRDHNAWHSRSLHLMTSKRFRSMSPEERKAELDRYGVFAFISTKDLPETEVLREYYMRQGIEQFFDYAKNYANYMPVRKHTTETIKGHLLLSFIATFLLVLIKNKLNILDNTYVAIPSSLKDEMGNTPYVEVDTQQGQELMIRQEKQMDIFKGCPSRLFADLQFQMADVFEKEIVPSVQVAKATQFYKTYHIGVPESVTLDNNIPHPQYKDGEGNNCTRRIAFARRSSLTSEQLEKRIKSGNMRKLQELAKECGVRLPVLSDDKVKAEAAKTAKATSEPTEGKATEIPAHITTQSTDEEPPKPKRGRPVGSKNKKTLEREAREAALAAAGVAPEKPQKRRPLKSMDKKTAECSREA